jgi:D-glycero-D-manno-heptose 1,7-bisphosphate phosphatase
LFPRWIADRLLLVRENSVDQVFWTQRSDARRDAPCLFLDRDGVVVEEVEYLCRPEDVRVIPGASALIEAARARGYAVGLVTNQGGIGLGYYDWAAFAVVQAELAKQLKVGAEPFDFIAACACHPQAKIDRLRGDHPWRKPAPGMLRAAADILALDIKRSIMIGDHARDIEAGLAAGVGRLVHLATGHGRTHRPDMLRLIDRTGPESPPVIMAESVHDTPALLGWTGA